MRYVIKLAYDGTHYGGWQVQKNSITVQQRVEEALSLLLGKSVRVTASGRTDAGVHAEGQVAHFNAETTVPPERMAEALNVYLPSDIRVMASAAAPENFDAIRSAKKKTYCYKFYVSRIQNPLSDRFAAWVKPPVNLQRLRYICGCFEGVHDFKAYCSSGSSAQTTVREIYSVSVTDKQTSYGTDVCVRVCGNGFLYNMVRTMVGTMLYFAAETISEEDIKQSLAGGGRELVGKTMPARGLTLESVDYGFKLF